MSTLRNLKRQILEEGADLRIDDEDWTRIRESLPAQGPLGADDLRVLTEMRTEARSVCAAFDAYFFPALKASLLADGKISSLEHFHLLRLLYGGAGIDDVERQFLRQLRGELRDVTPEFEAMYQQAMRD